QSLFLHRIASIRSVELFDYSFFKAVALGLAVGVAAMLSELPNSFIKRRFEIAHQLMSSIGYALGVRRTARGKRLWAPNVVAIMAKSKGSKNYVEGFNSASSPSSGG